MKRSARDIPRTGGAAPCSSSPLQRPRKLFPSFLLILLLAAALLWTLLYRLGAPNFYHVRNESRRAQIAQEMLQTGDWLIPHIEEETILTKPPVFYWSVALCSRTAGVTELTARLPSALAGCGTVVFTLLIGSLLFNIRTAFFSGFALISTSFFMHQARNAELESVLAFFVTGSIYFFLKGCRDPKRARTWYCLFFAMLGLGVMTKGPFALTFPLIPIIGCLIICGGTKALLRREFLVPSVFFLLVALPWPLAVMRQYPDFYKLVLWETVVRAATGYVHREPFRFYFMKSVKVLFPWIFVIPFSVWLARSQRLMAKRQETTFLLLWFLGNLLFLSLLQSKRDYYLFPITPSVALLVGATWEPLWKWIKEKSAARRTLLRNAVLGIGAVLAGSSFIDANPFAVNIPSMHSLNIPSMLFFIGLCMMIPACIKILLPRSAVHTIVFAAVCALMLLVHYLYFTYTVPILNADDSGKSFYRTVARLVSPQNPLGFVWKNENYTFTFYAERPLTTIKHEEDIEPFMASAEKKYLVMRRRHFDELSPLPWRVVFHSPFAEHASWRGYVLLCNR